MSDLAVWFDLDGTLLDFGEYDRIIERACTEADIEPTDSFRDAYNEHFFDSLGSLGPEPYRDGVKGAIGTTGIDADHDAFVKALRTAEFDAAETPEAVHEVLAELSGSEDASVGVLTNGVEEWQRGKLEANELLGYFDATLTSYEVGRHKPAPEVFARAEKLLPADEYVMVGDDDEADVVGAQKYGWRAIHVDGPESVADVIAGLR